jgi:glycine/D-amino acid oxidase-like deaminating enzyme
MRRGWWLREALAAEGTPLPAPPLEEDLAADVAIIGGGYTGMWTAWFLTETVPGIRIVLLEADICGGGPSGRNGGFVHGWWEQTPFLARQFGEEQAAEMAWAADEVVDGIGQWCAVHNVDSWFHKAGYLTINAFPNEPNSWTGNVAELERMGLGEQLQTMSAEEVQKRCASPVYGDGLWMPSAASIHPARLARGMRRVLLERGVRIHEHSPVIRMEPGAPCKLVTDRATVTAEQVVLAVNAWAAGWPGFRTRMLAWGSYMVMTEPIPQRLAEIGWTGNELLSDSRFTISYYRTTDDGRIAFGAGVGAAGFDGRIGRVFEADANAVARVDANFRRLLPMLADVRLVDAWGGPIDITGMRFPEIGSRHGRRVHYAHGFAGNGAGPARLAGRILAVLVAGTDDPLGRLALVNHRQRFLPPEPFRYIGARLIREALIREDNASDAGKRAPWWVRLVARVPGWLGYRLSH